MEVGGLGYLPLNVGETTTRSRRPSMNPVSARIRIWSPSIWANKNGGLTCANFKSIQYSDMYLSPESPLMWRSRFALVRPNFWLHISSALLSSSKPVYNLASGLRLIYENKKHPSVGGLSGGSTLLLGGHFGGVWGSKVVPVGGKHYS